MKTALGEISKLLNLHPDNFYLKAAIVFFITWICCTGPLRWFSGDVDGAWRFLLGVLPNFFAGITLVFWQTYGARSKPLYAFISTIIILSLVELAQIFMSTHRADWNDIISSFLGSTSAAVFISVRSSKQNQLHSPKTEIDSKN